MYLTFTTLFITMKHVLHFPKSEGVVRCSLEVVHNIGTFKLVLPWKMLNPGP